MDIKSEQVAKKFVSLIKDRFDIQDVIVYGSRARGDFTADSDLDIAVILQDQTNDGKEKTRALARESYQLLLEDGMLVSPAAVLYHEWIAPPTMQKKAFFDNIRKDGVSVWKH